MKNYFIDLTDNKKDIYSGHIKLGGTNPNGDKISFTNYYMELNGEPFSEFQGSFTSAAVMKGSGKMKLLR